MVKYADGFYSGDILKLNNYDGTGYYLDFYGVPIHTITSEFHESRWSWADNDKELQDKRLIADLRILQW